MLSFRSQLGKDNFLNAEARTRGYTLCLADLMLSLPSDDSVLDPFACGHQARRANDRISVFSAFCRRLSADLDQRAGRILSFRPDGENSRQEKVYKQPEVENLSRYMESLKKLGSSNSNIVGMQSAHFSDRRSIEHFRLVELSSCQLPQLTFPNEHRSICGSTI